MLWKVSVIGLVLAFAVAIPVVAYVYHTSVATHVPGGIIVVESFAEVKLYWDSKCTLPVTFIDFGEVGAGARIVKPIYIKNEGNVRIQLCWNSTLQDLYWAPNSKKEIWDSWNWDMPEGTTFNVTSTSTGMSLDPGEVLVTYYGVKVEAFATLGTYNWTLTVWGIY